MACTVRTTRIRLGRLNRCPNCEYTGQGGPDKHAILIWPHRCDVQLGKLEPSCKTLQKQLLASHHSYKKSPQAQEIPATKPAGRSIAGSERIQIRELRLRRLPHHAENPAKQHVTGLVTKYWYRFQGFTTGLLQAGIPVASLAVNSDRSLVRLCRPLICVATSPAPSPLPLPSRWLATHRGIANLSPPTPQGGES